MFFDAAHHCIYSTGLEGFVQAYQQGDADHYRLAATLPTVAHAGTAQFIPERDLLCVAVPPHEDQEAEVWIFKPLP